MFLSWYNQTFGHCIVCPSIYYFWLPPFGIFKLLTIVSSVLRLMTTDYLLWYLQTFDHCIVCPSIYYFWLPPFGIFKLLAIVSCVLLFTPSDYLFGIFKLLAIVLSVFLRYMASDYLFGIFKLFFDQSSFLNFYQNYLCLWACVQSYTVLPYQERF